MTTLIRCPECVAGKHGNCDGTAWDAVTDEPIPCGCSCRKVEDGAR